VIDGSPTIMTCAAEVERLWQCWRRRPEPLNTPDPQRSAERERHHWLIKANFPSRIAFRVAS
jgi:hypothetical protein